MTNIQAINLLKGLWQSLDDYCELNDEGKAAFCMAIEALNCSEFPNSSDCISRQAAIEWCLEGLNNMPPAEPKIGRDCTDFVRWLMDEVVDEENWQMNAVANGEIICRKLKKLGMLDVVDGYYIKTQETGGWTLMPMLPDNHRYKCSICNRHHRARYDYCPSCGARMKGGDNETD